MLGTTLILGGSGFIGSHIARTLLREEKLCKKVAVASRKARPTEFLAGLEVQYIACDIVDSRQVHAVFDEIRPNTVFAVSSPRESNPSTRPTEFYDINVTGMQNVLAAARSTGSVRALIYTSSAGVACEPHRDLTESAPTVTSSSRPNALYYHITKAEAERMVLAADDANGMRTVAVRFCLAYGVGDENFLPSFIDTLNAGQQKTQMGYNDAPYDFISARNVATGHVLAAKALYGDSTQQGQVGGEVFQLTDGKPSKFWDVARLIWRAAGDKTDYDTEVQVVPPWLGYIIASVVETLFYVFTLNRRKPIMISRNVINHTTQEHTYDISKARNVLRYEPVQQMEKEIEEAVRWHLKTKRGNSNKEE